MGAGEHADGQEGRPPPAAVETPIGDIDDRGRERHDRQHEVRSGGGDVDREPEHLGEQGDVDDAAPDSEQAGDETDPAGESRGGGQAIGIFVPRPVPLGHRAMEAAAPRNRVGPVPRREGEDEGGRDEQKRAEDDVEDAAGDQAGHENSPDRAGNGAGGQDHSRFEIDPAQPAVGDAPGEGVEEDDRQGNARDDMGLLVRVQQQEGGEQGETSAGADERPVRADGEAEGDEEQVMFDGKIDEPPPGPVARRFAYRTIAAARRRRHLHDSDEFSRPSSEIVNRLNRAV